MKAIFDDIREKLNDYIEEYSDMDSNGLHNLKWCAMQEALCVVNEAEQKWEEDVCEWKRTPRGMCENVNTDTSMMYYNYKSSCGWSTGNQGSRFKYCPMCGKKIKIREVE